MDVISRDDCSVCELVFHLVSKTPRAGGGPGKYDFGFTFDEILTSKCIRHRPLFQKFKDRIRSRQGAASWPPDWVGMSVSLWAYHPYGNLRVRWGTGQDFECTWDIMMLALAKRTELPEHPGNGIILDPEWIDMGVIKQWKRRCITEHGSKCYNPWQIKRTMPRWLIDIQRQCLVPGSDGDSYVCLSYRWGNSENKGTLKAMVQELQQPQSLAVPHIRSRISPIILHAMQLVRNVDERYLWADSLCIVQDDEHSMQKELNRMGAIYGCALFTIVAADGDSGYGLPGVRGAAPPRTLNQEMIPFGEETLLPVDGRLWDARHITEYNKRAWTYQEFEMSGRILSFAREKVHWECQCALWNEDSALDTNSDPDANPIVEGFPDVRLFSNMVREYNERTLSYDQDALNAISGMLAVFSRAFEGGFMFGLPIMFFELALCWQPSSPFDLRRREAPHTPASAVRPGLPSWSWVGWQGPVSCCINEVGLGRSAYYFGNFRTLTYPITTWHASRTPAGDIRYRICPSWFEKRTSMLDFDQQPPSGWKRHDYHADEHVFKVERQGIGPLKGWGEYVFEHEKLPGDLFWHPIPALGNVADADAVIPPQLPYISGQTTRTWLEAYREDLDWDRRSGLPAMMCLRDRLDNKVGDLVLHSPKELSYFPREIGVGTAIELVAICRQEVQEVRLITGAYIASESHGDREAYAVLWVEWANGIAYRRASGRVEKKAWDQHPQLETIDLVLG